jgi:hypothetical protein
MRLNDVIPYSADLHEDYVVLRHSINDPRSQQKVCGATRPREERERAFNPYCPHEAFRWKSSLAMNARDGHLSADRCGDTNGRQIWMVEIFEHPLFIAFVGLAFSLGFGPWLARSWQDHQREREIRTDLVTDMSRCIMNLVAILERQHPGSARTEAMANQSRTEKEDLDETANSVAAFDVDRCVIGTKLETYFLSTGDTEGLAKRWTTFADELIRFSATPPTSEDERRNWQRN